MSDEPAGTPPAAPKRGRGTIILAVVALLLLGGGGGYGYWWYSHRAAAAAPAAPPQATGVLPLDAFLVNLADRDASRFLRVTLKLLVDDEETVLELEKEPARLAQARSAILELLTTQESAALVTPEGKAALKKSIAERSAAVLHIEVRDVLFTDFVVQF